MHGEWSQGQWMPQDKALQEKGLTIPHIIAGYEEATGVSVDVAYVCKNGTGPTSDAGISPLISHPAERTEFNANQVPFLPTDRLKSRRSSARTLVF